MIIRSLAAFLMPAALLGAACVQVMAPAVTQTGPPTGPASSTVECVGDAGDSAALNAAVADSPATSEIVISGTCLLTETVMLVGGRTYRGSSRTGSVLRQADGANLPALLASDSYLRNSSGTGQPVTIRDLTVDGNSDNNTAATDGLVLRSWQTVVEDVRIRSVDGSGIRVTNLSADRTPLESTQVNGIIRDNFIDGSGEHGVFVEDTGNAVTDWQLINNWIADSARDGISMTNAAGWVITQNHLYGVGHDGIWAERMYGTTISDNYIEGFGEGTPDTYYGVGGRLGGAAGSTIALNRVFALPGERPGSTYRYIGVLGVSRDVGFVSVTGNVLRGGGSAGSTGLYLDKGNGASLSVASGGNLVSGVAEQIVSGAGVTVTPGS